MELEEIARSLEEIRLDMLREVNAFERRDAGPHWLKDRVHAACVRIYAVGRMLDDLADATAPGATVEGEGFVVLPIGRFDELREAEETLQETRFAPANGEHDDVPRDRVISGLECEIERLNEKIGRLRGDAKVRAEAAAPPRVSDEVLLKHIQDHQAEIDGIKDRLDEGCGEFRKLSSRIDVCSDRMGTLSGRMNRLEARDGLNPILRDEATRDRLLQEVKRAGAESTPP
jgi:hypothetical protein